LDDEAVVPRAASTARHVPSIGTHRVASIHWGERASEIRRQGEHEPFRPFVQRAGTLNVRCGGCVLFVAVYDDMRWDVDQARNVREVNAVVGTQTQTRHDEVEL